MGVETSINQEGAMHSTIASPSSAAPAFLTDQWDRVLRLLPADLDAQARATGAFTRVRGFAQPSDLLRSVLAYVVAPQWSFRQLGAWGVLQEIADLSHVALQRRMRQAHPWLAWLLYRLLALPPTDLPATMRLRLVDGTVISKPGSTGTDWRVHLSVDLARAAIVDVQITDATGAESLARVTPQHTEILVADRGYAYASSYAPHLRANQPLIGRANWHNMPLYHRDGTRMNMIAWLKERGRRGIRETLVDLEVAAGERYPMRLIAAALPTAQAAAARAKYKKQKPHASPAAVYATGFVLLLTTLLAATWSAPQVVAAYRLRWQIELRIKRLKSLGTLKKLRIKGAVLAQSALLAMLITAVVVEQLNAQVAEQAAAWWADTRRPVRLWRVEQWSWASVRQLVLGVLDVTAWERYWPRLQRYWCDPPRTRVQQLATARAMLNRLNAGAGVA